MQPCVCTLLLALAMNAGCVRHGATHTEDRKMPFVRIAELEIDLSQLQAFTTIVKEEMSDSIRLEPGVWAIYAVAERDNPSKLRFFEIYADEAAYNAHRESAHFRKYVAATQSMIKSRKLIDTVPLQLSAKQ
jgi:quinol monooxygenase YgiN